MAFNYRVGVVFFWSLFTRVEARAGCPSAGSGTRGTIDRLPRGTEDAPLAGFLMYDDCRGFIFPGKIMYCFIIIAVLCAWDESSLA